MDVCFSGFQPIPIDTVPQSQDYVLLGNDLAQTDCPAFNKLLDKMENDTE